MRAGQRSGSLLAFALERQSEIAQLGGFVRRFLTEPPVRPETILTKEHMQRGANRSRNFAVDQKRKEALMPELYEYLNPMPFEAAAQMEKDLTEDLRADGYTVAGGT
jgi:hypothetical protein